LGIDIEFRPFRYSQVGIFLSVVVLGGVLALLSGCTDQDIRSAPMTQSPMNQELPSSQLNSEGGVVTFLWSDITTLDPHLVQDVRSAQIVLEIFNGLVAYGSDMSIRPELAASWEIGGGGTEYIFSLKDGVTFHDGRVLTAHDIKMSIERATDPVLQSPTALTYLDDIVGVREKIRGDQLHVMGVEVVDERRIKFTLDQPKPYFLGKLTNPVAAVVDTANSPLEDLSVPLESLNGTGPFKLAEWVPEQYIRLIRNQYYINDGPFIDEAVYVFDGDGMAMYENNEIDIMELSAGRIKMMGENENALQGEMVVGEPAFQVAYIGFSTGQPPFNSLHLRRALFHAVDTEHIATRIKQRTVVAAHRILPPGFPAHNDDLSGLGYDLELAKEFLEKSGYLGSSKDVPHVVMTLPGTDGKLLESFRFIIDTWEQELGVKVKVQQTEWQVYLDDLNNRSLQIFGGISWNADYVDPHNFLDTLFHSDSPMNHSAYQNTDLDAILEKARVEQDPELRLDLYQQAEVIILEESPIIPLWFPLEGGFLVKPRIQGYFVPRIPMQILRYVWVE